MTMTSLCYIEREGRYLMLHRTKKKNDENSGKWIGLGGHFEPGESPEDCVLREVREETGLTLTDYAYRGLVTFVSGSHTEYMHLFTASGFSGELSVCDEGELEWIGRDELLRLTLWEGDRIFLKLIESPHPFFSLKLTYRGETLESAVLDGRPLPLNRGE